MLCCLLSTRATSPDDLFETHSHSLALPEYRTAPEPHIAQRSALAVECAAYVAPHPSRVTRHVSRTICTCVLTHPPKLHLVAAASVIVIHRRHFLVDNTLMGKPALVARIKAGACVGTVVVVVVVVCTGAGRVLCYLEISTIAPHLCACMRACGPASGRAWACACGRVVAQPATSPSLFCSLCLLTCGSQA